jgi:hypothetical protein
MYKRQPCVRQVPKPRRLNQTLLPAFVTSFQTECSSPTIRTGPNRLSNIDYAAFKDIYGYRREKKNMKKDPNKMP